MGKLKTSLTAAAKTLTRSTNNNNEFYLLFQSGTNGFSNVDTAITTTTSEKKEAKFELTLVGNGSKTKAKNQMDLNKVTLSTSNAKIGTTNGLAFYVAGTGIKKRLPLTKKIPLKLIAPQERQEFWN